MEAIISTGQEQRLTFRLLSYWNRIRGSRPVPALSDVNIAEIAEIWHHTFTIDLTDAAGHRFLYFGPGIASIFGQDYTGEYLATAMEDDGMLANTLGFYEKSMKSGEPAMEGSSFYSEGNEVRYRSLIVPLSNGESDAVSYLVGTTNYKIFTPGA
jgi:hypothetical protein